MKVIIDEIQQTEHDYHKEFMRSMTVVKLAAGETLEVKIDGVLVKTYTASQVNCHFNIEIQDKDQAVIPALVEPKRTNLL